MQLLQTWLDQVHIEVGFIWKRNLHDALHLAAQADQEHPRLPRLIDGLAAQFKRWLHPKAKASQIMNKDLGENRHTGLGQFAVGDAQVGY